jgi:hypothetical protein
MVAAPARFGAALDARFRRTAVFNMPVSCVLQHPVRPIHFEPRVHIDARTLRVIARLQDRGIAVPRQLEPAAMPVVARLAERSDRSDVGGSDVAHASTGLVAPPPVTMTLAHPAAAAASTVSDSPGAISGAWPEMTAAADRRFRPTRQEAQNTAPQIDVARLTDRVVAAIERRTLSARERLGI